MTCHHGAPFTPTTCELELGKMFALRNPKNAINSIVEFVRDHDEIHVMESPTSNYMTFTGKPKEGKQV